jgi:hypothetical protein
MTLSSHVAHLVRADRPAGTPPTAACRPEVEHPPGAIQVTFTHGNDKATPVRIHGTDARGTVVTTDRQKWEAFVLGVKAGEFDHFAEGPNDTTTRQVALQHHC